MARLTPAQIRDIQCGGRNEQSLAMRYEFKAGKLTGAWIGTERVSSIVLRELADLRAQDRWAERHDVLRRHYVEQLAAQWATPRDWGDLLNMSLSITGNRAAAFDAAFARARTDRRPLCPQLVSAFRALADRERRALTPTQQGRAVIAIADCFAGASSLQAGAVCAARSAPWALIGLV